ncbi:hypothetical protein HDU93_000242 [Gonapodya sp. JEL0774]|nr:hypothetical protein HDU93_000242 [Gonapodya sp. JEL0774]
MTAPAASSSPVSSGSEAELTKSQRILNFNVGILGHVDSGKTALAKALSTVASTAAFDKNPESRRRGITLDLGFSAFTMEPPQHIKEAGYDRIQITLVDCPGHASLVRTVIGGAQIIDLVLLVVDVVKGIQTQTAECLVLSHLLSLPLVCALNKIDLLPAEGREEALDKVSAKIRKGLGQAGFGAAEMVGVSANPSTSQPGSDPLASPTQHQPLGIPSLLSVLSRLLKLPSRSPHGDFIFEVDHCFGIKGVGTVMTGTVLSGSVKAGDTVEIPSVGLSRKVKSMQMFHKPVEKALQGDRLGLCVTQFDPALLERGLACSPGAVPTLQACIISASKVKFFKYPVESKAKYHVSIGHETVVGVVRIFGRAAKTDASRAADLRPELSTTTRGALSSTNSSSSRAPLASGISDSSSTFDRTLEYEHHDSLSAEENPQASEQYMLIEFEKPVAAPRRALVIGSRLDMDINTPSCRLAFSGHIIDAITTTDYRITYLPALRIFKRKRREGIIDRVVDDRHIIGRGLLKKETPIEPYLGLRVSLSTGAIGYIESSFGQTGKFKCTFPMGIDQTVMDLFAGSSSKKGKKARGDSSSDAGQSGSDLRKEDVRIVLDFKTYMFSPQKRMIQ